VHGELRGREVRQGLQRGHGAALHLGGLAPAVVLAIGEARLAVVDRVAFGSRAVLGVKALLAGSAHTVVSANRGADVLVLEHDSLGHLHGSDSLGVVRPALLAGG